MLELDSALSLSCVEDVSSSSTPVDLERSALRGLMEYRLFMAGPQVIERYLHRNFDERRHPIRMWFIKHGFDSTHYRTAREILELQQPYVESRILEPSKT